MNIKEQLIVKRKELGISQGEVAKGIGISQTALSRFELGKNQYLRFEHMIKYADILGLRFELISS